MDFELVFSIMKNNLYCTFNICIFHFSTEIASKIPRNCIYLSLIIFNPKSWFLSISTKTPVEVDQIKNEWGDIIKSD